MSQIFEFIGFLQYAEGWEGIVVWSGVFFSGASFLLAFIVAVLNKKSTHERVTKHLSWMSLVTGLMFFIALFLLMFLPTRIMY